MKGSHTITPVATFHGDAPEDFAIDASGNIFGTSNHFNEQDASKTKVTRPKEAYSLFEIVKDSHAVTTLASFPFGQTVAITLDHEGNVFGTITNDDSTSETLFEVAKGSHIIKTVTTFGTQSLNNITVDNQGNIFGLATGADLTTCDLVEITKGSNTVSILASFHGIFPGELILDHTGNLFGLGLGSNETASNAKANPGSEITATIFEVVSGSHTVTTVATSRKPTFCDMTLDSHGNIFGATISDGFKGGTVFAVH